MPNNHFLNKCYTCYKFPPWHLRKSKNLINKVILVKKILFFHYFNGKQPLQISAYFPCRVFSLQKQELFTIIHRGQGWVPKIGGNVERRLILSKGRGLAQRRSPLSTEVYGERSTTDMLGELKRSETDSRTATQHARIRL